MRKLWECENWNVYVKYDSRKGIRLRYDKDIDPEVKRASREFVNWLRRKYVFPIRVPIYFKATKNIISREGLKVSAIFWGPYNKFEEPYIRIAVGDYSALLVERGKDNALAAILSTIAHELSHYYQWIKGYEFYEPKMERQARYYAREILLDYAETRLHP